MTPKSLFPSAKYITVSTPKNNKVPPELSQRCSRTSWFQCSAASSRWSHPRVTEWLGVFKSVKSCVIKENLRFKVASFQGKPAKQTLKKILWCSKSHRLNTTQLYQRKLKVAQEERVQPFALDFGFIWLYGLFPHFVACFLVIGQLARHSRKHLCIAASECLQKFQVWIPKALPWSCSMVTEHQD